MALTKAALIDLNANELILDLDADTSITADTDDTIDFKIGGADEIKMTTTALSPATADGNALGTAALEWSDIYLADGALIYFGADQDTTLTHADGSGLTLNSTNKLMFNDASQFIQGSSATVLSLGATDEIDLTATLVDINANVEISGTATTTGVHTFTAVPVLPNDTVGVATLSATGTASSSTFLRGDNSWQSAADATKLPLAGGTLTSPLTVKYDTSSGTAPTIILGATSNVSQDSYIQMGNPWTGSPAAVGMDNSTNTFKIARNTNGNLSSLTHLEISSGGEEVTISAGDLIFGTAGKGICLGVTSNTDANTLDDYEEGTWTPSWIAFDDTNPTVSHSPSGTYVKVGKIVFLICNMGASASASGLSASYALQIGGLPFACGSSGSGTTGAFTCQNWNTDANAPVVGYTDPGTSYIVLRRYSAAYAAHTTVKTSDLRTSGDSNQCRLSLCYEV